LELLAGSANSLSDRAGNLPIAECILTSKSENDVHKRGHGIEFRLTASMAGHPAMDISHLEPALAVVNEVECGAPAR
jgi:hypothetical protein